MDNGDRKSAERGVHPALGHQYGEVYGRDENLDCL